MCIQSPHASSLHFDSLIRFETWQFCHTFDYASIKIVNVSTIVTIVHKPSYRDISQVTVAAEGRGKPSTHSGHLDAKVYFFSGVEWPTRKGSCQITTCVCLTFWTQGGGNHCVRVHLALPTFIFSTTHISCLLFLRSRTFLI